MSTSQPPPASNDAPIAPPDAPPNTPPPDTTNPAHASADPQHFRRGLGAYPLRNREATALFTTRSARRAPQWSKGSGCAYTVSPATNDPKT
eukprot:5674202-Pleurochrysis_carterae.AAC.1